MSKFVKTHGLSDHPLYKLFNSLRQRCYYSKSISYKYYGAKGVTVCDEWLNDFPTFYNWSIENGYEKGLQIDRIDLNGNYEPSNCRWVDRTTNMNNRTASRMVTYNGKTQTMSEWARELGVNYCTLQHRIDFGKGTFEEAFSKPIQKYTKTV